MQDRLGLGWRPELAAGILANLDRIDIVEVIADDYYHAPCSARRALRTLASQVPLVLHGVKMGLASSVPVKPALLDPMARLVEQVCPEFWSEHLAFVRGGGIEIGHLAAPPRNEATVEGTARNLARAWAVVGCSPLVENVATLMDPPGSTHDEATWVSEILTTAGCDLLLDLHNLYANATNFGFDALEYLSRIPAERIAAIHLAGGRWIGGQRILDDHLHDVPEAVYDLLTQVGTLAPGPLLVILERDGRYPPFEHLLIQLDRARQALALGRSRRIVSLKCTGRQPSEPYVAHGEKSSPAFEAFLARIYVEHEARARFLADPAAEAFRAGLTQSECHALRNIDQKSLELCASSFERKRQKHNRYVRSSFLSCWEWRLRSLLAGFSA